MFRLLLLLATIAPTLIAASAQTPQAFVCPVTLPNTTDLHGLPGFIGEGKVYEEDELWLGLPAEGIFEFQPRVHATPDDQAYAGWIPFKLHVHRGSNAGGHVRVTGEQVAAPSEERAVNDPTLDRFYGKTGFVPVALMIPGEGCWEFAARSGDAKAGWVMEVRLSGKVP